MHMNIREHFHFELFPFRENTDREKGEIRDSIKNTPLWLSPSPLEGENLELKDCIYNSLSNYIFENRCV